MKHPDRKVIKRGGGCLVVIGLLVLLAGGFGVYQAIQGKLATENGDPVNPVAGAAMCAPFVLAGLGLMFGRSVLTIDRDRREVSSWFGVLVPFRTKRWPLDTFDRVSLSKEIRRGDKSSYTVYPVRLVGGGEKVNVAQPREYEKARREAEDLSRFVNLKLEDASTGLTVTREVEELDESIRQQVERRGETLDWPELPANSRIEYRPLGESGIITIPEPGFHPILLLAFVPAVIFGGSFLFLFVIPFFSDVNFANKPPAWLFVLFMCLFLIVPIVAALIPIYQSKARDEIVVSRRGLQIQRTYPFGKNKKWTIPADELEELEITDPSAGSASERRAARRMARRRRGFAMRVRPALTARSDKMTCRFGMSLTNDELRWLRDAIRYILAATPQ